LASRIIGAGRRVILVGAAYDAPLAEAVAIGLENGDGQLINLASQTTLGELAAVLERCVAFVGNDTGAMHLAVAVGTPALALFGPTDPQVYGPYRLGEAITAGLDCSPCFLDGRAPNCQHQNCMEAITVEQAWAALLRVIDGRGAIK
jgi:ADP-heptose:LPS heptosyltransferase